MRKDRNTFFQESSSMQASGFYPGQNAMMNPNMQMGGMPLGGMNPGMMANPTMMNPNMVSNSSYTSELESRISRIERQINRLETRVNKLEMGTPSAYMNKEDNDTTINQSMYMV